MLCAFLDKAYKIRPVYPRGRYTANNANPCYVLSDANPFILEHQAPYGRPTRLLYHSLEFQQVQVIHLQCQAVEPYVTIIT